MMDWPQIAFWMTVGAALDDAADALERGDHITTGQEEGA